MKYLFLIILFLLGWTHVIHAKDYVDDYTEVSHQALSDLIWKYNIHSLDNDKALNAYFQKNNCELFSKYYSDDFQWQTIMDGFKRNIRYFSNNMPQKFYIVATIPIDRYDFTKSAFIINKNIAMKNAGSIQIPFYGRRIIKCEDYEIEEKYFPDIIDFIADRKFSLTEIPVNPLDANQLLSRIKNNYYVALDSNRALAVRFLITINGIESYTPKDVFSTISFKGSLDEIAFFEDPELTIPVWKKQFKVFED